MVYKKQGEFVAMVDNSHDDLLLDILIPLGSVPRSLLRSRVVSVSFMDTPQLAAGSFIPSAVFPGWAGQRPDDEARAMRDHTATSKLFSTGCPFSMGEHVQYPVFSSSTNKS